MEPSFRLTWHMRNMCLLTTLFAHFEQRPDRSITIFSLPLLRFLLSPWKSVCLPWETISKDFKRIFPAKFNINKAAATSKGNKSRLAKWRKRKHKCYYNKHVLVASLLLDSCSSFSIVQGSKLTV